MILDTGGLLIVLLVLTVPVVVYVIQRGKRNKTNALLADIRKCQQQLERIDPVAEINGAASTADLDAIVRRRVLADRIDGLISRLPEDLRSQVRCGSR